MSKKIYGLIACGGKSRRMGFDKCLLRYHDIPQWKYIYQLLEPLCDKVIISCNETQSAIFHDDIEKIVDVVEYTGIGPMSGLLSAFLKYPDKTFLFIGCDYPFIITFDLQLLCNAATENKYAVSMINESRIYEPLLAIYHPISFDLLKLNLLEKKYSLRSFLEEINAGKVVPSSKMSFLSIDTFEEYQKAKSCLGN